MVDLHTHSTVSDGSDPPEAIPELAAAAGCSAVALTDHDSLAGLEAAGARAAEVGVELVPGCEIACDVGPGTMHLLAYWVEPGRGPLPAELERLRQVRVDRNRRLAERLAELGVPVTLAEMEEQAGGGVVARPHAAAVMVRKGVAESVNDAFERWLAKGRPAYVDKEKLAPEQAIALARNSGAVPVLAHPLSLGLDPAGLESAVAELAAAGLAGMECAYGRYSPDERRELTALAGRHGMVATGGSDYHGTYKPDLSVGVGRGDLAVDDSVVAALAERRT